MEASGPLISVAMPTHETEPRHLREAVDSVLGQTYPNWELCIVDDGSRRGDTLRALRRLASRDSRVTTRHLDRNSGISNGTNEAVSLCSGELIAFLDHDDALTPDALEEVSRAFARYEFDVAYSDSDKLTPSGERTDPFHKPDWSPVYALGAMYVGHLLVVRRSLLEQSGGLDPAFDTIQDYELLLRLCERAERIHHIPRVLYHWRAIPGSIAADPGAKPGVPELQARAVNEHLRRRGITAEAVPNEEIPHRIRLRPRKGPERPPVSVVIPSRGGGERALAALRERTLYEPLEVIVEEDEGSFRPAALANRGADHTDGEYLVFLGEDVEVTEPDWIERLLLYAEMPGVGAVGPTLVHPDGRVSAAGVAIGLYDPAVPAMRGFEARGDGYYGSLSVAREVSAIGMDCMLVRRSDFEAVGGFEQAYRRQFHDHDLCLRLRSRALSVVCAPEPTTIDHTTEARRRSDFDVIDRALFVDRWWDRLAAGDPYYSPSFFRAAADYSLPPFGGDALELALRETVG
jgi:GT2 family glycosyltransferase